MEIKCRIVGVWVQIGEYYMTPCRPPVYLRETKNKMIKVLVVLVIIPLVL